MVHSFATTHDSHQQEIAKWCAIFESLAPLKKRTVIILEGRYGPKMGRFLKNPATLGFLIDWDFSGASIGMSHLHQDSIAIDPNQLLREISILEAYGASDDFRSSLNEL
ncbi:hypothetical protein [Litoribrevibacter albus]|uniref:Uncharacterized protein n=1 Tax=Litoribrevibacter albus TaxID=1473156 RepID=A0AA37SBI1_9GAMM|nr:hypothetical protein [Litoribrevibacter albus]GLQ32266.1 hypothetical protein GCM10007876_27450 [Litoribrevibacter albus]